MDQFLSRKKQKVGEEEGCEVFKDLQVKEVIHPKNVPSVDTFAIFAVENNTMKFKGFVPQVSQDVCYYAWRLDVAGKREFSNFNGKEDVVIRVVKILKAVREPLTGQMFCRLMNDHYKHSMTRATIEHKWQQCLNNFHKYGFASALLDQDDENISFDEFLDNKHPPIDFELTHESVKDRVLNKRVLSTLDSTTSAVVASSPYFFYTGTAEEVLRMGLGPEYRSLYPEEVVNNVLKIIRNNPVSLFYRSLCPARIEVFDKKVLPIAIKHSQTEVSPSEIAEINVYNQFHKVLQYSYPTSTCFPMNDGLFSPDQAILDKLVAKRVLTIKDAPDPANSALNVPFIQDGYFSSGEELLAQYLHDITDRHKSLDPGLVNELLRETGPFAGLDPVQKHAIRTIANNSISIVIAGPGHGKTTVLKLLVAVLAYHFGLKVLVSTPTNVSLIKILNEAHASMCLVNEDFANEWLADTKVWNNPISKIRDLNENLSKIQGGTVIFRTIQSVTYESLVLSNGMDKLTGIDVMVWEEASMLGMEEPRLLLEAVPGVSKLVIFGDINQNPPVREGRLLQQLCNYAATRPHAWSFNKLTKLHRVAADSILIDVNLKRMLAKKFPLNDVSHDFSTAWTHVPCGEPRGIVTLLQSQINRNGWSRKEALQNTMIISYNHDDVDALNAEVFKLLFPDKTTEFGTFHKGEKVVFLGKQTIGEVMMFNNTLHLIKKIELYGTERMPRKLYKEFLLGFKNKDFDDLNYKWNEVEEVTRETWWRAKLTFENNESIPLFTVKMNYIKQGYAHTSYATQSLEAHTVFVYITNHSKHIDGPRPVEDLYMSASRAIKQVCIFGNMLLLDDIMRKTSGPVYAMLDYFLSLYKRNN